MNQIAPICRGQAKDTRPSEPPADRAMRLMGRAMDALDQGRVRDAADWMEQANSAVQTMLAFAEARAGRT